MKNLVTIIMSVVLIASANAQIKLPSIKGITQSSSSQQTTNLSDTEIISGLKEALTIGSKKASDSLQKTNAFNLNPKIRVPFPEDCKKVAEKLRAMGYGKKVDEFEVQLNRAAELAAKEAAPIFTDAIKQMSFADAKKILTGPDTAATGYLRKSTYNSLYGAFYPHIKTALNQTLATRLWTELTSTYNKIPTTKKKVETDLVKYTTNKSLKGVFTVVADEEMKIRKDPVARTTQILQTVFGSLKK